MVRSIYLLLFKDDEIASYSPTGGGGHQAFPSDIYEAVEGTNIIKKQKYIYIHKNSNNLKAFNQFKKKYLQHAS